MMTTVRQARPFLKWAGGKGQLINQIKEFLPPNSFKPNASRNILSRLSAGLIRNTLFHNSLWDIFSRKGENIMMSKQMRRDIEAVLNYLWYDEKKDYYRDRSRKHIYLTLKRLAKEIKYREMSVRYTVRYDEKNGYMLGFSLQ